VEEEDIMKERCILWGIGRDYEKIINQVHFEMYKGNIVIEALVCRKEDRYCDFRDGVPIIEKEKINAVEFDYLIITSSCFYNEIRAEAIELGVEARKIINGVIFQIPLFDFSLYSELIKNPVTILSDDCWGGVFTII